MITKNFWKGRSSVDHNALNTIFLFGGQSGSVVSTALNTIYTFDTSANTNQWNAPTTLSTATSRASAVAVGTMIYITGGTGISTQTLMYDTTKSKVPPQDQSLGLSTPRVYHASFYIPSSQKIFLVGGISSSGEKAKTVESLDLSVTPASREMGSACCDTTERTKNCFTRSLGKRL
jgi:hypothetical protein